MATLGTSYLNLADRMKRTEGGEMASTVIEMMNEIIDSNTKELIGCSNKLQVIAGGLTGSMKTVKAINEMMEDGFTAIEKKEEKNEED